MITSEQIRAARALLRWEQRDLADASKVSLPSIKRLETTPGALGAQERTIEALRSALEAGGVEFIAEDTGGAGVRMWKPSASVKEMKSGFRVEVAQPGHALPHALKDDFRSEREAKAWAESDEAKAFVDALGKLWWDRRRGSKRGP